MEPETREVCQFFVENRCRFGQKCRNFHPPSNGGRNDDEIDGISAEPQVSSDEVKQNENRVPVRRTGGKMRTAADVLHRICWDSALNSEDFSVVYLDRFIGSVSVPLDQFQGIGIRGEIQMEENIPQHRIQQFCYKNQIVWDKQNRIDFVFGSAGSGETIIDFIQNYEEIQSRNEVREAETRETNHEPDGVNN